MTELPTSVPYGLVRRRLRPSRFPGGIVVPIWPTDHDRARAFYRDWNACHPARLCRYRPGISDAERERYIVAGKLGEVVVGRVVDQEPLWDPTLDDDGGKDFTLPTGTTVDVKAIPVARTLDFFGFSIKVQNRPTFRADVAVLVLVPLMADYGIILGATTRAAFERDARRCPRAALHPGQIVYTLTRDRLRPFADVLELGHNQERRTA